MKRNKGRRLEQMHLWVGRGLKSAGARKVLKRDPVFHDGAMACLRALAACEMDFTSDNLRSMMDLKGLAPKHPNSVGAVIRAALVAGVMEQVGYQQSEREAAHARVVAVYRGGVKR